MKQPTYDVKTGLRNGGILFSIKKEVSDGTAAPGIS